MSTPEFTPAEIEDGIVRALNDRQLGVIPGLIKLLAVQDPHRAQAVLDTFEIGRVMRAGDAS